MMGCSIVRRLLIGIGTVGMVWLVCGCGGGGGSSGDNFELRMVDSSSESRGVGAGDGLVGVRAGSQGIPLNAATLEVTIDQIRAIPEGGPPVRRSFDPPIVIDLMSLSPTFTVWDEDLPPGEYVKLELIVSSAQMTFDDGTDPVPVTVPSGPQTGLKFPIKFTIANGIHTTLVLDWNTGNSLHQTGNGVWMLRPTAMTVTEIQTQETVDDVSVTAQSLAPPSVGANDAGVPMLQLDFTVNDNFATIDAIDVSLIGTVTPTDVTKAHIWRDAPEGPSDPPNGVFNPLPGGSDVHIGEAEFSTAGVASINFDQIEVFTAGDTLTLFVTYDLAYQGTISADVGASIEEGAISSPDTIVLGDPLATWPLQSGLASIPAP